MVRLAQRVRGLPQSQFGVGVGLKHEIDFFNDAPRVPVEFCQSSVKS